jgi:hypothetical protein
MRWQITPLLYAFGLNAAARRPLRFLVAEPMARHGGSVEAYVSPEFTGGAPHGETGWMGRAGLRAYVPILDRGETLSWSAGGSYYRASAQPRSWGGAAVDVGLYTLFGTLGAVVTYSPGLTDRQLVATLNVRIF